MDHLVSRVGARRRRFSAKEREELLARYEQSGVTQRDFAAGEEVALSTLASWLRRARAEPARARKEPLRFGEVTLPGTVLGGGAWVAEITRADGRALRVGAGVPEGLLVQLLRALE